MVLSGKRFAEESGGGQNGYQSNGCTATLLPLKITRNIVTAKFSIGKKP